MQCRQFKQQQRRYSSKKYITYTHHAPSPTPPPSPPTMATSPSSSRWPPLVSAPPNAHSALLRPRGHHCIVIVLVLGVPPCLSLLQQRLAGEDEVPGARHEDAAVLLPVDEQIPPRQRHPHTPLCLARQNGGNGQCARASATGKGGARAALPDLHFQMISAQDLNKLGVDPSRESWVFLKYGSNFVQVKLVEVVNKNNCVRVSHADTANLISFPIHFKRLIQNIAIFILGQGGGDVRGLEDREPHVHPHQAVGGDVPNDLSGKCVEGVAHWFVLLALQFGNVFCENSDSIPAHFWFRSIRVEDSHGEISPLLAWEHKNHTIAPYAKVAIAKLDSLLWSDFWLHRFTVVHQNKIISQTFILAETDCVSRRRHREDAVLSRSLVELQRIIAMHNESRCSEAIRGAY
mmetsp:Transcript_40435/g.71849  ORF Transcript_40435/g.71849 Transcript_40435/m.71849 type:complete len:404 (-) Transcript_40435:67-1278(-)